MKEALPCTCPIQPAWGRTWKGENSSTDLLWFPISSKWLGSCLLDKLSSLLSHKSCEPLSSNFLLIHLLLWTEVLIGLWWLQPRTLSQDSGRNYKVSESHGQTERMVSVIGSFALCISGHVLQQFVVHIITTITNLYTLIQWIGGRWLEKDGDSVGSRNKQF